MSNHAPRLRGYALFNVPERLTSYVLPWAVVVAVWPATAALHLAVGHSPLWVGLLAVGFTYLGWATWKTWAVRKQDTRNMVTFFAIAVLAWALFAVAVRPWQSDVLKAWAIGGPVLCVAWCIRHAALSGVREVDKSQVSDGNNGMLDRIRAFKDARVGKVTETADELRHRVHLDAPTTAKEAQDAREQLAALAGVGADQVKVLKVKGDESQVDVVVNRTQDVSRPVVWKGPRHLGKSIADAPIWLGRRTDGSDINWWIVGDDDPKNPRPLAHTKCTGVTGAGKTETICSAILAMRERIDIVPVVGDPAKFQQSFGDIEDVLGLAAKTQDEVEQLVANLKPLVEYRSGLFGSLTRADGKVGYKQWVPELWTMHRIPAIFIDIEEAADIAARVEDELDEAVRKLRSLGVHLCLSMQTMPHDNISRKTRGQFAQSLAHGQMEMQDARYALDASTLDAGADPTKWRNDAPGSLYAEVVGTDRSHWPIDGRAVYLPEADKERSVATSREFWAEMDPGSWAILSRGIADEQGETVTEPLEGTVDDDFQEVDMSLTSGDGIDVGEPLAAPRGPSVTFATPRTPLMSMEDARAELLNRIHILSGSNETEVTFDALQDIPELTGMPRGWVYEELEQLADDGVLKRLTPPTARAVYEITGSVFAEAAAG